MSANMEFPAPLALVTGATSGIGREVARTLAADGFSVLVHGRDAARGAAVVDEIAASAKPAEIADVIAFLALPKAAYITGAVIAADGGRTAS